jgi:hypothetical protein
MPLALFGANPFSVGQMFGSLPASDTCQPDNASIFLERALWAEETFRKKIGETLLPLLRALLFGTLQLQVSPCSIFDQFHTARMPAWTHLIRFIAVEDGQIHLGQPVDTARDIGEDCFNGIPVKVFRIEGSIYAGDVTEEVLHVQRV